MELQWPLILFTTLVAWSAGLFGAQAVAVLRGGGGRAQMPALVASVALLAAGGIAVFFHLQHWERIFNGFGHLTSGITQELIAIVVFVVVAVAYFVMLRKSSDGTEPNWLAVCAVVIALVTSAVCAHSYTMAARPAWDSLLEVLSLVGASCVMGPATYALILAAVRPGDQPAERAADVAASAGLPALVGALVNAVTATAYAAFLQLSGSSFADVGLYFDPTHPTKAMADAAAAVASQAPLLWVGAVAVGALVPLAAAVLGRKSGNWKLWGTVALAAALIGAVCLRIAFYNLGLSVFMFY